MTHNWSAVDMANNSSFLEWEAFPTAPMEVIIGKSVAIAIVTIVAIVGNILVICAVGRSKHMHTVTNYLIVNMSIADFLYIIVIIPATYVEILGLTEWAFATHARSVYFCNVVHFGQYLFVPVSVLTLATIAADRFFAIVIPLRKILTKKVFRVLIVLTWVIAIGLAAPTLYAYRLHPVYICYEEWTPAFNNETGKEVYTLMIFIVAYCVPFLIITTMYTVICTKLWLRKIPGEANCRRTLESRKKVVKMLITVVIFFILCWLPVQIVSFMWFYGDEDLDYPYEVDFFLMFMMRLHAAVSPCIYAGFSQNYRQAFKSILTGGRCDEREIRREYSVSYSNTNEALIRRSHNGSRRWSSIRFVPNMRKNSNLSVQTNLENCNQLRRNSRMQNGNCCPK